MDSTGVTPTVALHNSSHMERHIPLIKNSQLISPLTQTFPIKSQLHAEVWNILFPENCAVPVDFLLLLHIVIQSAQRPTCIDEGQLAKGTYGSIGKWGEVKIVHGVRTLYPSSSCMSLLLLTYLSSHLLALSITAYALAQPGHKVGSYLIHLPCINAGKVLLLSCSSPVSCVHLFIFQV